MLQYKTRTETCLQSRGDQAHDVGCSSCQGRAQKETYSRGGQQTESGAQKGGHHRANMITVSQLVPAVSVVLIGVTCIAFSASTIYISIWCIHRLRSLREHSQLLRESLYLQCPDVEYPGREVSCLGDPGRQLSSVILILLVEAPEKDYNTLTCANTASAIPLCYQVSFKTRL